ncbi:MAG TPA: hypothetical protein ENI05_15780 [Porticoccus sp.]|nr:hypothetical protein [Porticoccus sp.]
MKYVLIFFLLVFFFLTSVCFGSVKIGIITDVHYSDKADEIGITKDFRIYSSADARMAAAATTFNAESVDFICDLGDMVQSQTVDEAAAYASYVTAAGSFNADYYCSLGNHDTTTDNEDDFFGGSGPPSLMPALDGTWYPNGGDPCFPWAHFDDVGGVRQITLLNNKFSDNFDAVSNGVESQVTWLTNALGGATTPVVIFAHWNPLDAGDPTVFTDILDADTGVVAVFAGHDHLVEQVREDTSVPYFDILGSVSAQNLTDTTNNAYYIFDVSINSYLGVDQRRSYIVGTFHGDPLAINSDTGAETKGLSFRVPSDGKANEWKLNDAAGQTTVVDTKGAADGVAANNIVRGDSPISNGSIVFNGSSDFITAADILINEWPWSASAWFKSTAAAQQTIFCITKNEADNRHATIRLDSTGVATIAVKNSVAAVTTSSSTKTYNDGLWHQITGVFINDDLRLLYVDSELVATNAENKSWPVMADWAIGRLELATPTDYFNGSIDQVAFYPFALSASQVRESFNSEKPFTRGRLTPGLPQGRRGRSRYDF